MVSEQEVGQEALELLEDIRDSGHGSSDPQIYIDGEAVCGKRHLVYTFGGTIVRLQWQLDEMRERLQVANDQHDRLLEELCKAACTCGPPDPNPSVHREGCNYRSRFFDALDHAGADTEDD